jgi:hypothetical protein
VYKRQHHDTMLCFADRRAATGAWLDNIYEEKKTEVDQLLLSSSNSGSIGALATDGWKRKAAEQEILLIVNVLLPTGAQYLSR